MVRFEEMEGHVFFVSMKYYLVILGLLFGIIYFQLDFNERDEQNVLGALFFATMISAFTAIMTTVLSFPPEKAVVYRESGNNLYSITAYFVGKSFSELPFQPFAIPPLAEKTSHSTVHSA